MMYHWHPGTDGRLGRLSFSVGLVGYLILIVSRNATLSYVAVYLAACGIYPTIPNIIAWVSNNVEGSYKRSVSLAMVISFGNINGAVSSNVVRTRVRPSCVPNADCWLWVNTCSTARTTRRGTGWATGSC